jgi:GT2 family glycosyltransferase
MAEPVEICVVDNASADGSGDAIAQRFPGVHLIRLDRNLGAAGRNYGVQQVTARYVAFCDDDCWWAPGSLGRALTLLDAYPRLAAITARVLIGPEEREDPTSIYMATSPLPNALGIPGSKSVTGILAGACVMRRQAFLEVGGYEPRLFIGGEETLLSIDLMAGGWHLAYVPDVVVHHHPSFQRDTAGRKRLLLRNALWCAWLRRPLAGASRETLRRLGQVMREPSLAGGLLSALGGLPWVLKNRRVVPAHVESRLQMLEKATV